VLLMPDKKKSVLIILVIGICGVFFLSRKYFRLSCAIEKNAQEGENPLLGSEETALLLTRIENMLGESTKGKKPDIKEAGRTFHLEVPPDDEKISSSAIRKSDDKQEVAGGYKKDEQTISQINQRPIRKQVRQEWPSEKGKLSAGQGSATSAQVKDESSSSHGGFIGIRKADDNSKKNEPLLKVANVDVTLKGNNLVTKNTLVDNLGNGEYYFSPPSVDSADQMAPDSNDNNESEKEPEKKADKLTPTPWSIDFFGRVENAKEGSWVYAYDSEGKVCGKTQVKKNGMYGILHIFVDDLGTEQKEGMRVGESITFKVDGQIASTWGPDLAVCQGGSDLKQVNLRVDSETKS